MYNNTSGIVQKVWSFCDTLRDDGVSYGDYIEQLTYLFFLKMADEHSKKPDGPEYDIPKGCTWQNLLNIPQDKLIYSYENILKTLASSGGMLNKIFSGAQNKIHDSGKLSKLIRLINEETWTTELTDIKGDIYESLLQKNAESSGAGQYFTPRPVIKTIVECIQPGLGQTISDPACGTGGFFLGALEYIRKQNKKPTKELDKFLKFKTFHGWEIVPSTARLCLMNLFLHGIGDLKTTPKIEVEDSLKKQPQNKVDIVLANPPFGKSSSETVTPDKNKEGKSGYIYRADFWASSSNKQLNFLQHIVTMLEFGGKAAVVMPDNILFEGGAGEIVRENLLDKVNLHTILRLPTGIFYAQGVKANILFFEKPVENAMTPCTKEIWFYDYRTNIHHTLKRNPLKFKDLREFIICYNPGNLSSRRETYSEENPEGRWRKYAYDDIISRDKINLDIFWIKDNSLIDIENLPESVIIMDEIIENIESALASFMTIRESIE